jgi:hypothetical protein
VGTGKDLYSVVVGVSSCVLVSIEMDRIPRMAESRRGGMCSENIWGYQSRSLNQEESSRQEALVIALYAP